MRLELNDTMQRLHEHFTRENLKQLFDFQDIDARRRGLKARKERVSFAKAIAQMATQRGLHDGPEHEFFTEAARARGESLDPHRVILPITFLNEQRDLNVAQASAGGFLVGSDLGAAQDILRPWSVVINGGVSVEEQLTGNVTIPRTVTGSTIYWQVNETTQATPSTPTISQVTMTPKIAIALIQASRNFVTQANPERWLRRELKRAAGAATDTAVLTGSGAAGQPQGVLTTPGLSTQSGTALAWAGVLAMKKNTAVVDAPDASIAFLSNPTTRALLEAREKAAGNGDFLWQDDKIASCPAFVTTLMPAGQMLSGPMSGITLGLWGDLRLEVNPFDSSLFKTGAVQIRVLVAVDVAVNVPLTAFTVATSIT